MRRDVSVLDNRTAYSFLFQTEKPKENLIVDGLTPITPLFVNSVDLYNLAYKGAEIKSSNTISMKTGSNVSGKQIAFGFLSTSRPEAIEFLDLKQGQQLFEELQKDRIVTNGVFAGTLLLNISGISSDIRKGNRIGSIVIGVVDKESNKPLGIVFCPERMFEYKFVDHDSGKKRKRVDERVLMRQRASVGVGI